MADLSLFCSIRTMRRSPAESFSLPHRLRLKVIAEGGETEARPDFLRSRAC